MNFIHGGKTGTEINIYKVEDGILEGTFFTKEKPKVGDTIEWLKYTFIVSEIIENRDARITGTCTNNLKDAYFKMRVNLA